VDGSVAHPPVKEHSESAFVGASVGADGATVGGNVGVANGGVVGTLVGCSVGAVGAGVGDTVGAVGDCVGPVGDTVGATVGIAVVPVVGEPVGSGLEHTHTSSLSPVAPHGSLLLLPS